MICDRMNLLAVPSVMGCMHAMIMRIWLQIGLLLAASGAMAAELSKEAQGFQEKLGRHNREADYRAMEEWVFEKGAEEEVRRRRAGEAVEVLTDDPSGRGYGDEKEIWAEDFLSRLEREAGDRWWAWSVAGDLLSELRSSGEQVDGRLVRRVRGSLSFRARDEARARQCYLKAYQLAAEPEDRANAGLDLAGVLEVGIGAEIFRLTDLSVLPEPEQESSRRWYREADEFLCEGRSPMIGPDGEWRLPVLRERFEDARTDGERIYWLLSEAARISRAHGAPAKLKLAAMWDNLLGVRNLSAAGYLYIEGTEEPTPEGELELATLKDDETILIGAKGPERRTIPAEFSAVTILRGLVADPATPEEVRSDSTWELMEMLADRYQFDALEEVARKALAMDPDNLDAQEYLERIGPAGEFAEGASFAVGEEAAVDFISREVAEQRFELWRMDIGTYLDHRGRQIPREFDNGPWEASAGQFEKYRSYYTRILDWTVPIRRRGNHLQSVTRIEVPVTEAGNYLVVANVRGRWQVTPLQVARTIVLSAALDARAGWDDRETWVSGGNADLFLIDVLTGKPVEGAVAREVGTGNEAVSDHTGYLLGMGADDGLVVKRPGLPAELLWVEREDLDELKEDEVRSFLVTNQPLYRPGQKVEYAGWLKRPNGRSAGLERIEEGAEVRVRVSDPVGQLIHEVELPLDEFGGFAGSFMLAAEMVLGSCTVELSICHPDPVDPFDEESEVERRWVELDKGYRGSQWQIEVGEFRKPDFQVEVEAGTAGKGITAVVKASYHSGEAVAGAAVTARLSAEPVRYQVFPEQEWDDLYEIGYDWELPRAKWLKGWDTWGIWPEEDDWQDDPYYGDEVVVDATAVTGADGKATLTFPAELPLLGNREYHCTVSAGVQEFTGRTVGGRAWFIHSGREHEILIRPELGFYREGEKVKLEAWTLNADREPVAGSGRVRVESVDAAGGLVEVWSKEVITSESGMAEVEFLPATAGQYRCVFNSGGGERGFVLEVIGEHVATGRQDGVQLIPRQPVGATGDLAEVLVQTGEDEALVWLFEQRSDGRRRTPRLVETRNGSAVVSLPLDRSAMPEMYLQAATMVKGRLKKGTCRIVVPPVDTLLKVNLAADPAKAEPGEQVNLAIGVTDAQGKVVPASLAVTAFDQALEDLGGRLPNAGDRLRDRFDGGGYWPASSQELMELDPWERSAFRELDQPGCFFERSNLTGDPRRQAASRFEKLGSYLGIQYEPPELPNSIGGARDPMAAFPVTPATPGNWSRPAGRAVELGSAEKDAMRKVGVRKNFADRAFWGAALRTDANGQVRTSFDLPDNLTAWRVQTWAFGKGRAHGDAEIEIEVSKSLQVRPLMPQAAVEGDSLEIGAMVQNLSASRQEFLVTMESDSAASPPARSVRLAAGEEGKVVWPVVLTEAGRTVFKLRAASADGSLADGAEFVLPVASRSVPVTLVAKSEIAEGATRTRLRLDCPEAAGAATLRVRLEAKAAVGALAVLPDLVGYPHGCTEQTLNRFLPTLVAWQAADKLGIDWESMQQVFSSGGSSLGWVKGRSAVGERPAELSEDKVRAMIHVGLHRLNELQGPSGAWGWFAAEDAEGSVIMTALAVRGIALARDLGFVLKDDPAKEGAAWLKQWTIRRAAVLAEDPGLAGELDAWVAFVLADSGERETAGLTKVLVKSAGRLPTPGLVHLALAIDAKAEPAELQRIMALLAGRMEEAEAGDPTRGDAVETRAWYLKLLARSGATAETLEPKVRDLMLRRTDGIRWSSTKDSALCVEAIIEASIAGGGFPFGDDEVIEAKIDAAGGQRTIRLDRSNLWSAFLTIPLEAGTLNGGNLPVMVERSGTIPMLVAATLGFESAAPDRMAAADQGIRVERTFHRVGPGGKRRVLGDGEKLKSGELIEVVLTMTAGRDLPYVHLRDPIPAGLEPLIQLSGYESGAYRVSRTGETDFFISSLSDWNRTQRYFLRAVTPGNAVALPARAECMYQPEIHGQSGERRIEIGD